jgi:tetratricopeptide (TPR) repeat protein
MGRTLVSGLLLCAAIAAQQSATPDTLAIPLLPRTPDLNESGNPVAGPSAGAISDFNLMVQRGRELLQSGRSEELRQHVEKLLRSAEALGPEQKSIGLAWIGSTYAEQGRSADAERALVSCVKLRELLWGHANQTNPGHARILTVLGGVYIDLGQDHEAEKRLDEAGTIWRSIPGGSQDPGFAAYLNNSGMLRYGRGRYSEAEPYLREAVASLEKAAAGDDQRLAQARAHLALILSRLKLHDEADVLSAKALGDFKHN